MVAIIIGTMTVHDPETYRKYTAQTPALIAKHGGRFVTRGAPVTTLEGEAFQERMIILDFPTREQAEALFNDPEYVEIAKLRQKASTSRVILQDGVKEEERANPNPGV